MARIEFDRWKEINPDITGKYFLDNLKSKKWGSFICRVREVKKDGTKLDHVFAGVYNKYNGDGYIDDNKLIIFTKFFLAIPGHVIQCVGETFYHLLLIDLVQKVRTAIKTKMLFSTASADCIRSVIDVVRIPAYRIVLIAVSIAALVSTIFGPKYLYKMREVHGKIEQHLHWGIKLHPWALGRCFQPISLWKHCRKKIQSGIEYEADPYLSRWNNFAFGFVKDRRTRVSLDNCFRKLDPNKPYITHSLTKAEREYALQLFTPPNAPEDDTRSLSETEQAYLLQQQTPSTDPENPLN